MCISCWQQKTMPFPVYAAFSGTCTHPHWVELKLRMICAFPHHLWSWQLVTYVPATSETENVYDGTAHANACRSVQMPVWKCNLSGCFIPDILITCYLCVSCTEHLSLLCLDPQCMDLLYSKVQFNFRISRLQQLFPLVLSCPLQWIRGVNYRELQLLNSWDNW